MKNKVFYLACLLFIFGCRQASKEKECIENNQNDLSLPRIAIKAIDENSVLKFSDIFENISFIKLETLDNSLIGRINKIIATEDKFIILDSSIANMVFVFNKDGTFSNRIGSRGEGPEEYASPEDIAYDKYDDELLIWDHNRKSILRFKLDGTFVGRTVVDWWASAIYVVEKNTCLLFLNNTIQKNGKPYNYNMVIINKEGKILEKLLPYDKETGKLSPPNPSYSYYGDEIIYSPYYGNQIFKLEHNKIEPKYFLDFGSRKIPESSLENKTVRELDKVIKERGYAFNTNSLETSTHVICQFVYKKILFDCYYSKKSGNTKISAIYFNDMFALTSNRSSYFLKGDSLISYIEPKSFTMYKNVINDVKNNKDIKKLLVSNLFPFFRSFFDSNSEIKKNYSLAIQSSNITLSNKEIDFIDSIDETDNPILMIATLKKF